jgi:cytochrome c1
MPVPRIERAWFGRWAQQAAPLHPGACRGAACCAQDVAPTRDPTTRRRPCGRPRAVIAFVGAALAATLAACTGAGSAGPPPDATPGIGDAEHGKALFTAKACNGCHSITGLINGGTTGPNLWSFSTRERIAGTIPNTPENVWKWLANPQAMKPGTGMPRLPLTAQDLDDLTAFLETLK